MLLLPGHAQSEHQHLLMFNLAMINNKQVFFSNHHHPLCPAPPVTNSRHLSQPPSTTDNPQHMTTTPHANANIAMPCHQASSDDDMPHRLDSDNACHHHCQVSLITPQPHLLSSHKKQGPGGNHSTTNTTMRIQLHHHTEHECPPMKPTMHKDRKSVV